jgi:hypothetical protein
MAQKKSTFGAESAWISAGLIRYRKCLEELGGRSGATSKGTKSAVEDSARRALVAVIRAAALGFVPENERARLRKYRLFDDAFCLVDDVPELPTIEGEALDAAELGTLLEALLAGEQTRKQSGMYYTPRPVVDDVAMRSMAVFAKTEQFIPRIVDPACGGGAFLFGVARAYVKLRGAEQRLELRRTLFDKFYGFDIEPLAVAVSELSLAIWAGVYRDEVVLSAPRFRHVDSLEYETEESFDLVIGNPPWVAYAGRATQPLSPERRSWFAKHYDAFRGYPTLHACFVELGARLARRGRVALLVPSPVADLDGYRPMRRVLSRTHQVCEELVEYGQDAFEGVVQPCFALIADAFENHEPNDAPFSLVERAHQGASAERVEPPSVLARLRTLEPFDKEIFRELGFQTNTVVSKNLLLRNASPEPPFDYPLLEGRDVNEFRVGEPKLFLNADRDTLRRLRCKLRALDEYREVKFVVRQTAKYPIAALHNGFPFRNSLIAGFDNEAFPAAVLVGLLNSTLLRVLHLATQRDARQTTFPQVKLVHLRSLPAPPPSVVRAAKFGQWVSRVSGRPLEAEQRRELDAMVFDWYGVSADEATAVEGFYLERTSGKS